MGCITAYSLNFHFEMSSNSARHCGFQLQLARTQLRLGINCYLMYYNCNYLNNYLIIIIIIIIIIISSAAH